MWKFRSMVMNADALKDKLLTQNQMQGGVTFKMKNDPRITRIGKWIRKFSIDEVPQLWNVMSGDMSLVGPRPPVPREVREYSIEDRQRLLAKPGLTCFWQVAGRSEIDFAGQVRLDVEYIRSKSVWLDFMLLLKTIPAVLLGKGAY
jgi:lipopolysaccharide/colanic/teichoic acid biosynthesis glycosyltransferase